jgi:hypothetical protein
MSLELVLYDEPATRLAAGFFAAGFWLPVVLGLAFFCVAMLTSAL